MERDERCGCAPPPLRGVKNDRLADEQKSIVHKSASPS